jgi:hypothetical protein
MGATGSFPPLPGLVIEPRTRLARGSTTAAGSSFSSSSAGVADVPGEQVAGGAVQVAAAAVVPAGGARGGMPHGVLQVPEAGAGVQTNWFRWRRRAATSAGTGLRPGPGELGGAAEAGVGKTAVTRYTRLRRARSAQGWSAC